MSTLDNWKWLGVGAVAGLGCLYLGYRFWRSRSLQEQAAMQLKGKSYERSDPLTMYVSSHNTENGVLSQLRTLSVGHEKGEMTSPIEVGKLLTILTRALNTRKAIDVGVFTGCSAFAIALALPEGCKVVACDVQEDFTNLGKPYWTNGGVADKIDLRLQPAADTLQELLDNGEEGTYDIMFLDADKPSYPKYYELGVQLLRPGGLIVIDNALWGGRVVDQTIQDKQTIALRELNKTLKNDTRVDFLLLNLADGIGIVQKLEPKEQ